MMNAVADAAFNYSSLPVDKAASARAAAERIRGRMQLVIESAIAVGKDLIDQKKNLGHGNYLSWIESEFQWSQQYADKFAQVARVYGENYHNCGNLSFSAFAALAAPSTPPEVREQVEGRAAKGEKVTAADIEKLKKQLAAAKEKIEEKEGQRQSQESRAELAAKQVRDATSRALFAESDKERLAGEVAALQDEISRLSEDGVITVIPQTISSVEPTVVTVTAPTPSLLMQVFDISSDTEIEELLLMRRERIISIEERASLAA